MADVQSSIAIVGAAGYVGRQLLKDMERAGLRATAIVRGVPELTVGGTFHKAVRLPTTGRDRFDVVINLAYPTAGSPITFPEQNRRIVSTVDHLLAERGRLIHVSTQAVFGLAIDRRVRVGPVAPQRDEPYVEAKIDAEVRFERMQRARGLGVDIVRLGNVWGAASGSWALPIVQRLITGRPVGLRGVNGFSNATDVANASSYLVHVLSSDAPPGVRYHHVAEFSAVPWERWIAGVAQELGVEPVHAGRESMAAPVQISPMGVYRALAGGRVSGSYVRTILRALPRPVFAALKGPDLVFAGAKPVGNTDRSFLAVVSATQEFRSHVLPGWNPAISETQSMQRVIEWLRVG